MMPLSSLRFLGFVLASISLIVSCANPTDASVQRQSVSRNIGYTLTRNFIFTPEQWPEKVPADLYQPNSTQPSPAVLLIHGGGWTGTDGRWQMDGIARKLVKRGYFVMNVTYRLAPEYTYPAPVDDMREALRWMRTHAVERGIDPARISAFGYSAGGYLAAMVGFTSEPGVVRAVVSGGTPGNLALYPGGKLVPQFLGGTCQEIPQRFREASPVNHISRMSPPTFVYHATEDKLVPLEHAWAMIHGLEKFRVPHEVYWINGRDHIAAFLFPAEAVDKAIDFLDRENR